MASQRLNKNDHGLGAPWPHGNEITCLAANRRTTRIETSNAGKRRGDVELDHEHWACASFR